MAIPKTEAARPVHPLSCSDCVKHLEPALRKATALLIQRRAQETGEPIEWVVARVARGEQA